MGNIVKSDLDLLAQRLRPFLDRLRVDELFLLEHAQRGFIAQLLRRYGRTTQDRFLSAYQSYFNTLKNDAYLWRQNNREGSIWDFLAEVQPFILPPTRGGSRKGDGENRLIKAVQDVHTLLPHLKKVKRRFHNPAAKKLQIREVLVQTLHTANEIPEKKLNRWASLPRKQIATEAAAYVNGLQPSYLERNMRRGDVLRIQHMLSDIGRLTRETEVIKTAIR